MNYLRESINIDESIDVDNNITKTFSEIRQFQIKIRGYIETNYVEFLSDLTNNQIYLEEGNVILEETESLLQNIQNETKGKLLMAQDEIQLQFDELAELIIEIKSYLKILKIDDLFQKLDIAKTTKEQLIVMGIVFELKTLIYDATDTIFPKLNCYQNIKIKYQIESEFMLHNLKLKFEELVQYNQKTFQNTKSVTIKITKDENQLHETVIALMNAKYNPKIFCDFLLENVFEPIITKPTVVEYDENNSDFATIQLSYSLKPLGTNLRPNYKIVFANIKSAIMCLGYMNVSISETVCVFSIFSEYIKEKFFNLIIHDCLSHFIPDTMDEMNESTIVDDIIEFHKFLTEMLLLNDEIDDNLIKYAEKIGILFRNRFCTNILDNAIDIMRKDLHDMILVTEGNPTFPRCMISKSILELISLMEKVIKQANATTDPEVADRLLSTVSIILDRYLTEVPTYHSNLLLKIPQQTALFRNNNLYLAYWLLKNSDKDIDEFSTITKALQNQGNDKFLCQIKNQRTQIIEILHDFGYDLTGSTTEFSLTTNKIVGQCLRQLDLLKNVWQTILPESDYNKTMGNLLNDFCNEIINRILAVEDIPTPVADGLGEIISTIIQRAPSIFEDPLKVSVYVKSWMKLTQLKMLLGASLVEITEQWSDGKGPLILNYKAEELKFLIRALFQNTDRRAKVLSLIL